MLDTVLEAINTTLSKGEDVTLTGFGVFKVKDKAGYIGRNPRTGSPIPISATKAVVFRPGLNLKKNLKKTVNHMS